MTQFIALKHAEKGEPIYINLGHVRNFSPNEKGGTSVQAPVGNFAGAFDVVETCQQIMQEISRLNTKGSESS